MKLTELNPRWVEVDGRYVGVAYDCPCCVDAPVYPGIALAIKGTKYRGGRLAILFADPIGGGPPLSTDSYFLYEFGFSSGLREHHFSSFHAQRTGETFETLTLSPSINCDSWGHWHGHIVNGKIDP